MADYSIKGCFFVFRSCLDGLVSQQAEITQVPACIYTIKVYQVCDPQKTSLLTEVRDDTKVVSRHKGINILDQTKSLRLKT